MGKAVMDSIRQSVDNYEVIFTLHPMPMWLFDENWEHILTANQAAQDISGYTQEEFFLNQTGPFFFHHSGQPISKLFNPRQGIDSQIKELHLLHKDGQSLEVDVHCQRLTFRGQPAFLLIAQDISSLKQSEQALRQAIAELSRSNAMIAALSQVAVKIESLTDMNGVIETLGSELEIIGLSSAITYLFPKQNTLQIAYISINPDLLRNLDGVIPAMLSGIDISIGPIPSDELSKPLYFTDVIEPLLNLTNGIPEEEIRHFVRSVGIAPFTPVICLPLKVNDEVIGNLSVWGGSQRRENIPALTIFANQVSGAIEKARLFEAASRRAKETEMLFNATTAVTSALELNQVLDQILVQLAKVVPYFSAAINLIEGEDVRIVAGRGFPDSSKIIDRKFHANDSLLMEAYRTSRPLILADAQQHATFQNWADDPEVRGWMGVPLIARGQVIGFLTIDHHEMNAYQKEHAALAQAFANEVAIAIENARLFQEVQILAITDPLLGIYNRRHFYQLANEEFKRFKRYHAHFSMVMFDLDHFKDVNDKFGHQAGDQVLRHVVARCQENLREQDIFGRYGGEEFVILTHQADNQAARQVADRLREVLAERPIRHGNHQVSISASFGVCELTEDCPDLDELINRADQALYTAKRAGKNQVAIWEPEQEGND